MVIVTSGGMSRLGRGCKGRERGGLMKICEWKRAFDRGEEEKSRTVRIKDWEKGGQGMNIRLTDREGKKVKLSENGEQRCW